MLTCASRPEPPIAALAAGLAVGSTVMLLVFRTVDPNTWIDAARSDVEAVLIRRAVDLVAAVVVLIAGAVVLRRARRPRPARAVRPRRRDDRPDCTPNRPPDHGPDSSGESSRGAAAEPGP